MLLLLTSLLALLLLYTAYADLRFLLLPVGVFPPLLLLWAALHWHQLGGYNTLLHAASNTLLVVFSLLLLRALAHWRNQGFLNHAFGSGDLLFLLAFAWSYPPFVFLWVWLCGTLTALLLARLLRWHKTPYAGMLALTNIAAGLLHVLDARTTLYPTT